MDVAAVADVHVRLARDAAQRGIAECGALVFRDPGAIDAALVCVAVAAALPAFAGWLAVGVRRSCFRRATNDQRGHSDRGHSDHTETRLQHRRPSAEWRTPAHSLVGIPTSNTHVTL